MGRRRKRTEAQGRDQGRGRGRVQQRAQGRPQGQPTHGGEGRKRATLDVDAIESYANRLSSQLGGSSGSSGSSRSSGTSDLAGVASGLAGAASGLAGGSLASRLTGGRSEASEEFENEVRGRLDLMEERLQRVEEEMLQLRTGEATSEDPTEPPDPGTIP